MFHNRTVYLEYPEIHGLGDTRRKENHTHHTYIVWCSHTHKHEAHSVLTDVEMPDYGMPLHCRQLTKIQVSSLIEYHAGSGGGQHFSETSQVKQGL